MVKRSCSFVATAALFIIINAVTTSGLKGGYEDVHTYNYAAKINVGVDGHVSEYCIDGLLKIQRVDKATNKYMLSLSDLKQNSYYGKDNFTRISESNSIDNNVLQIPFYATYDEDGQYKHTGHPKKEPEWSENIKKSIASLLQFNWSIVQRGLSNEGKLNEDDIERDKEDTIHGKCKVDYIINKMNQLSKFSEKLLFIKSYTLNTCNSFTSTIKGYLTNYKTTKETIKDISNWDDSSIRNAYELDINNGVPIIKMISNFESYTYNDNIDDVVYIKDNRPLLVRIRQNVIFNNTNPDERFFEDFQKDDDKFASRYADNANVMDTKGLVDRIMDVLLEVVDYMEKNHLSMIDRGAEHRQLFNKVLSLLKFLGPADFAILESKVITNSNLDKMRHILVSMLPYVSTKDSLDFVVDIISKKKISDNLAIELLTRLPPYWSPLVPSMTALKLLAFDNNHGEMQLSPKVYETAVVSYSHLLNNLINRFPVSIFRKRFVQIYLPNIVQAFEAANTTSSKLVFLSAIGNVRHVYTVNFILAIFNRRSDNVQDRLRLAAINILSELIREEEVLNWVYCIENLTMILEDRTESKLIRLAAYDVLVNKISYYDFSTEKLIDFGRKLSDDKDMYNYHLSTIESLQQVGILNRYAKMQINPSGTPISSALSRSIILKADNVLKPELLKYPLKLQSVAKTYLKLSLIVEDQSLNSNWRIPSVVKFEILEGMDEHLIVNKAIYFYTNLNRNAGEGVYFDLLTVLNKYSRSYYMDTVELKDVPNLLDLTDIILQKLREKLLFRYDELTEFSLKTGFGIDARFEHKYPAVDSMLMDYHWKAEENYIEAKVDFSMKLWSNGYSGVSMHNPLSGLTHSVRKTQLLDSALSFSIHLKYDFSKHELNLTIPVNSNDLKAKESGIAIYSSTSVGITDANDDMSCDKCGFRVAARYEPKTSLSFRRSDYFGYLVSHMTYNCDPGQSLDLKNMFGNSDDGKVSAINTCGFIGIIRPNTSNPISQIELLVNADAELSKSMEKPWYFLPGSKVYFKSSIGTRHSESRKVHHLFKLDFNVSSSQGHFSNILHFKFVKTNDDDSNLILCVDGKADFPETDDNHLPSEISQSTLNAFSRFVIGQSQDDSCSSADFAIDCDLTGEVSKMQKDMLESIASNSLCAKQKSNRLYVYPQGSYPLTEDCLREMISNTTLRRYKLGLSSEQFSDLPLLQALLIIRSAQDKLKEMVANSHNADVEVKMVSAVSDIRMKKQMSFLADYPVPDIYRNLPNIYFSHEFVLRFIDKKINVINVYPKLIVYNNEEKPFSGSHDWNEIYTGVEKAPYKIFASVVDNKISYKILYKSYELILKPKLVSSDSSDSLYIPQIYYNQQLFSDFNQRLHLFSTQEILFSLSRVDDYMVIRSDTIPVTVYYTTNSINILQKM